MTNTHPELLGLLDAVLDAPGDDGPRLVTADWLEDHGDEARAEFIRVQVELARMGDGRLSHAPFGSEAAQAWFCVRSGKPTGWHRWGKRCRCKVCSLRRREYETSKRHSVWDWCRGVPAGSSSEHHRGFVASVSLTLDDFLAHAAELFAWHPVEGVTLGGVRPLPAGNNRFGWTDNPDHVPTVPWCLPPGVFSRLWASDPGTPSGFGRRRWYTSSGRALAALSAACCALGRDLARPLREARRTASSTLATP